MVSSQFPLCDPIDLPTSKIPFSTVLLKIPHFGGLFLFVFKREEKSLIAEAFVAC